MWVEDVIFSSSPGGGVPFVGVGKRLTGMEKELRGLVPEFGRNDWRVLSLKKC